MTVMVKKLGGSVAVLIPNAIAKEMGLKEGVPMQVTNDATTITMSKRTRRPRRRLSTIVRQMNAKSYRRHTRELGADWPVGKELL